MDAFTTRLRDVLKNILEQAIDPDLDEEHAAHGVWKDNVWSPDSVDGCCLCEAESLLREPVEAAV